jgi:uncharacterized membrane protein
VGAGLTTCMFDGSKVFIEIIPNQPQKLGEVG